MKILKASAGSGKTYRLSHQYIDLLMNSTDRYAYRHILAVTFTNKATAEMKSRILRDLNELSAKNPKAREILVDMLHDYGAFSVCTIDKFFQQALKAFSREIGQMADYQIELDRKSLIHEAMDRLLDSLTEEDTDLLRWIRRSVAQTLDSGQRCSIEQVLYEMGERLKSEEHRRLAEESGNDVSKEYSKERLDGLHKECRAVITDFEKKASALGLTLERGRMAKIPGPKIMKTLPADAPLLFEEPYDRYCTAWIIDSQIFSLGLAREFYREFDALLKEKNIMCLDESNSILRRIIDGSDAPFVYEKLGVRYENFLLDEFQDTSNIQWENFLPLLRESESKGGSNLIVGDVKQSIYRWRDSEWDLLGSQVEREFPGTVPEVLKTNWRSASAIVDFNNGFFEFASRQLGLDSIYSDVSQQAHSRSDAQTGSVRVTFCDDQNEAVLASIEDVRAAGAQFGDIAILVRKKNEGTAVAGFLMENGIPFISDDSLTLKSSVTVRRLVSLLSGMENPDDKVSGFLAGSMGMDYPEGYHSLVDLAESVLRDVRDFNPKAFAGETLYIQAFMDLLQTWCSANGNNLHLFLKYWTDADPVIGCPEDPDSVRIITVHKSKGLEFPYVIFPYADKVGFYKADEHWCILEGKAPFDGLYSVELNKAAERTYFRGQYFEEKGKQLVDNMNVFYVALTRAVKGLHVISRTPTKTFRQSLDKNRPEPSCLSDILYMYCGRMDDRTFGTMYDFAGMDRKCLSDVKEFAASYPSIPLGNRLCPSEDASDFFGEDGSVGVSASVRIRGKVLHDILSRVDKLEDLSAAVDSAIRNGKITAAEAEWVRPLLQQRISAHREWFCGGGNNEMTLFDADGAQKRPDRVIVDGGFVTVIDYKFASSRQTYIDQVKGYMEIFRRMGYADVRGFLWFVGPDRVVEITSGQ